MGQEQVLAGVDLEQIIVLAYSEVHLEQQQVLAGVCLEQIEVLADSGVHLGAGAC